MITNDNYTHNNLDNGSTYYYKVAAVNASGTGTLSSIASALLSADIQGSESYSGHTYALTTSTMNWAAAANAASALGGYLVTLNTRAENTWLYDKFGKYGGTSRDLWIGSKDNLTEGTCIGTMVPLQVTVVFQIISPLVQRGLMVKQNGHLVNLMIGVVVKIAEQLEDH